MSSEAVGGRTPRLGELEWDLDADTTSSGALAGHPKVLRKSQGISVAWCRGVRCGIVVSLCVAMGQRSWLVALAHLDQMYKLAEEERCCGNNLAVVFVCGELLRKSVANRAEWNDRSLGLWSCSESGISKSWKLLEHVYCQPVQVVTPPVWFSVL